MKTLKFFLLSILSITTLVFAIPQPQPLLSLKTQEAGLVDSNQPINYCEISPDGLWVKTYQETFKDGVNQGIDQDSIKRERLKTSFDSAEVINKLKKLGKAETKESDHVTFNSYTLESYKGSYTEPPKQQGVNGGQNVSVEFYTTFADDGKIYEKDSPVTEALMEDLSNACQ